MNNDYRWRDSVTAYRHTINRNFQESATLGKEILCVDISWMCKAPGGGGGRTCSNMPQTATHPNKWTYVQGLFEYTVPLINTSNFSFLKNVNTPENS